MEFWPSNQVAHALVVVQYIKTNFFYQLMCEFGMKTERRRTELSAIIFVFTFFAQAETNTETPEMNMKTDTAGNRHGVNTKRIWKQT